MTLHSAVNLRGGKIRGPRVFTLRVCCSVGGEKCGSARILLGSRASLEFLFLLSFLFHGFVATHSFAGEEKRKNEEKTCHEVTRLKTSLTDESICPAKNVVRWERGGSWRIGCLTCVLSSIKQKMFLTMKFQRKVHYVNQEFHWFLLKNFVALKKCMNVITLQTFEKLIFDLVFRLVRFRKRLRFWLISYLWITNIKRRFSSNQRGIGQKKSRHCVDTLKNVIMMFSSSWISRVKDLVELDPCTTVREMAKQLAMSKQFVANHSQQSAVRKAH